ncbi:MAG: hypothetical protein L0213_11530, partial [Candidatus Dadabacteria bacterium]|nr:hypothetical protein [Candidatus Dadabacteria bacterium]
VRTLLRRREGIGNAITIVGFIGFAVYMSGRMETFIDLPSRFEWMVPVFVVAICLFLAATVLCLIPALGVVSKDGKAAWALRVSPVPESMVAQGKALSVFLMAPFVVAFVAVPLPLLTGMSWYACLFAALGGLAMCALHTGIGMWFGARYPNFDEAAGNAPDAITMYIVMLAALGASLLLLGPAVAVALNDRVLGVLALIFAVDLSFLVLVVGTRGAARQMKGMELAN